MPQESEVRAGGYACLGADLLIIEPNNAVREAETQLVAMILVPWKPCILSWLLLELELDCWSRSVRYCAAPSRLLRACTRRTGMCT